MNTTTKAGLMSAVVLMLACAFMVPVMFDDSVADPTTADVASIGDVGYTSLQAAIVAAEADDTIVLLANITLTEQLNIEKSVSIDLNGKNITGDDSRVFRVLAGGLTLTGEGIVKSIAADTLSETSSVIIVDIEEAGVDTHVSIGPDVTILANDTYGITLFGDNTHDLILDIDCTIISHEMPCISGNGTAAWGGTIINIGPNASLTADECAIYHPQSGTLTINGGVIDGGIEAKAGNIIIPAGKTPVLSASDATVTHNANNDGESTTGYAIVLVQNSGYAGPATLSIAGGTVNGPIGIVEDDDSGDHATATITGGNFSTLDCLNYLGQDADVRIVLAKDTTVTEMIETNADITIDLNGKTVLGDDCRIFRITGGDVVIDNGTLKSVIGTAGKLTASSSVAILNISGSKVDGSLTLGSRANVIAPDTYGITVFGDGSHDAVLNIDCKITSGAMACVSGNGTASNGNVTINIGPDAVLTADGCAVYNPQTGTTTFNGGVINGSVEAKAGNIVVPAGMTPVFNAPDVAVSHNANGNGESTTGYAIVLVQNKSYGGTPNVPVRLDLASGTVNGPMGIVSDDTDAPAAIATISGGFFSDDAIEFVMGHATHDCEIHVTTDALIDELFVPYGVNFVIDEGVSYEGIVELGYLPTLGAAYGAGPSEGYRSMANCVLDLDVIAGSAGFGMSSAGIGGRLESGTVTANGTFGLVSDVDLGTAVLTVPLGSEITVPGDRTMIGGAIVNNGTVKVDGRLGSDVDNNGTVRTSVTGMVTGTVEGTPVIDTKPEISILPVYTVELGQSINVAIQFTEGADIRVDIANTAASWARLNDAGTHVIGTPDVVTTEGYTIFLTPYIGDKAGETVSFKVIVLDPTPAPDNGNKEEPKDDGEEKSRTVGLVISIIGILVFGAIAFQVLRIFF